MDFSDIVNHRLANQNIATIDKARSPEDVLTSFSAMQAQDYPASLWAIGLRCKDGTTQKDVEDAILKKRIARTWLMRGTLHFAASKDMHWMLNLFKPRLLHTAIMRDKHLGLSDSVIEKTKKLFYNALKKEKILTRSQMYEILDIGGVPSKDNLGYHMLYRAAWDGLICFGPMQEKEQTFVLLDDHVKERNELSQAQANAELALRYFTSHGPATIKDYVWWSGLTVKDAKIGIESNNSKLGSEVIDNKTYYMPKHMPKLNDAHSVHLLPAFDEYLVAYADRSAALGNPELQKRIEHMIKTQKLTVIYSNGIFSPVIVVDGAVVGTWKRKIEKDKVTVTLTPYIKISKDDIKLAKEEVGRYGSFLGIEAIVK